VGFGRRPDKDTDELDEDGYRARDFRSDDEPSHAVTGKARSWTMRPIEDVEWKLTERQEHGAERAMDEPAMTITSSADNGNFRFEVSDQMGEGEAHTPWYDPYERPSRTVTSVGQRVREVHAELEDFVVNTGRDWKDGGSREDAQQVPLTEPAPAIDGKGRWHVEHVEHRRGGERIHEGVDPNAEPSMTVTSRTDRWHLETNRDFRDGEAQQERSVEEPAPTISGGGKQLTQWEFVEDEAPVLNPGVTEAQPNRRKYDTEAEPAPTLAFGHDANSWTFERPATTVQGAPGVWPPGHKVNASDIERLGEEEALERYGVRAAGAAIRLRVEDALVLQSFRPEYPLAGSKTKQFEQVGNACPPLLAAHVLTVLMT
jgi:site-specific DNA-cytosine methylase